MRKTLYTCLSHNFLHFQWPQVSFLMCLYHPTIIIIYIFHIQFPSTNRSLYVIICIRTCYEMFHSYSNYHIITASLYVTHYEQPRMLNASEMGKCLNPIFNILHPGTTPTDPYNRRRQCLRQTVTIWPIIGNRMICWQNDKSCTKHRMEYNRI